MTDQMNIRKMTEADAPFLVEINRLCGLSPWGESSFIDEARNILADYMLLEENGKIIGYAGMWCVIDEASIMNIGVLPEFQGRGCGKLLMERMIDIASKKGCTVMLLEVKEHNEPALALYTALGFETYDRRKKYYHDGVDALLMKKELG